MQPGLGFSPERKLIWIIMFMFRGEGLADHRGALVTWVLEAVQKGPHAVDALLAPFSITHSSSQYSTFGRIRRLCTLSGADNPV